MATYAYIRKSQTELIVEQLTLLMAYKCKEIFIEEELMMEDKELLLCLETLKNGDTLIIPSLATLGKKIKEKESLEIIQQLKNKNIHLVGLKDGLDTEVNTQFYEIYSYIYQTEKAIKKEVSQQLSTKKRSEYVVIGRPTLKKEKIKKVEKLYLQKKTLRKISEEVGISLGSVHKYVNEFKREVEEAESNNQPLIKPKPV